ncbi:MAG: hypothetical protein KDC38_08140 [Planctomycetes bacterium]|nr:hypothetical protein [Planctomycetota bacterium]
MWHRRIPHHSAGSAFDLADHEDDVRRRVGAELEAAFGHSVDHLQALFQSVERFDELVAHFSNSARPGVHEESLAALWNVTCREDLQGRRPIELYLRELIRAPEIDPDEDYGTKHVQCADTGSLLKHADFVGPTFFSFVEGRDLHGLDMAPRHSRFTRIDSAGG